MVKNNGVSPQAGPGCQPPASAAEEASSQSGIPNAALTSLAAIRVELETLAQNCHAHFCDPFVSISAQNAFHAVDKALNGIIDRIPPQPIAEVEAAIDAKMRQ